MIGPATLAPYLCTPSVDRTAPSTSNATARAGVLAQAPFRLLTKRSPLLRHHADQVSVARGRIDASDGSPEAALREAEEFGLDPAACTITLSATAYASDSEALSSRS